MIRAFAAIALPEAQRFELRLVQQGLPVPRTVAPEALHLTLAFLGEVEEAALAEAHEAFGRIDAPGFSLSLRGLGMFGGAAPRAVWAGVAESAPLKQLQQKVEGAARRAGLDLPHRRFVPHVTLARINAARIDRARLERFVAARAGFATPAFAVEDFRLYRSHLGRGGAQYEELARYPLPA